MTRLAGKPRSNWKMAVLVLLGLVLAVLLGAWSYWRGLQGPAGGAAYTLEVKPGDSLAAVARTLQAKKIIKNADVLRFTMKQAGTAGKLKEGLYDFTGDMNVQQVADKLAGPARIPVVSVTIPEGKRIKDIPAIFAKAGFPQKAIAEALQEAALSKYAKKNLEGFVFPATYEFRPKDTALTIVKTLVARMDEELSPANIAAAKKLGLTPHDWVTLASMVQAEAANDKEMPLIAGIFLNRIREGIPLGSDPTVAYGVGKDLPELSRPAGDFLQKNGYNTYIIQGLPEGPINNPGQAALQSVLHAKRKMADGRDALYFLHGKNGKIYINHDYQSHLRDRDRYMY